MLNWPSGSAEVAPPDGDAVAEELPAGAEVALLVEPDGDGRSADGPVAGAVAG
jgi:hypothetical protein